MSTRIRILGAVVVLGLLATPALWSQAIDNLPEPVREQLEQKQQFLSGAAHAFFFGPSSTDTSPAQTGCIPGQALGTQPACSGINTQVDNFNEDAELVSTSSGTVVGARFRGQSETTIAIAGSNQVVSWNDATGFFVPSKGLSGIGFSTDGGQTWCDAGGFYNPTNLHIPYGDDTAVADRNGTFFIGYLYDMAEVGEGPISTLGVTSISSATLASRGCPDNLAGENNIGAAPVIAVAAASDFLDKPWMAIDPNPNPLTGMQNLYLCYTRFVGIAYGDGQIELVRSTDGGATWNGLLAAGLPGGPTIVQPDQVSADDDTLTLGYTNQGCNVTVGPNHEVYVVWEHGWQRNGDADPAGDTPTIRFAKSLDFGSTFTAQVDIASFHSLAQRSPNGYSRAQINDFPQIAVDRSPFSAKRGSLYVTWHAAPAIRSPLADILVAVSRDGGTTWQAPIVVNSDGPGRNLHFMPTVSVDDYGNANFTFFDRRDNPFTPSPYDSTTTGPDLNDPALTNLYGAQIPVIGSKILNWRISDVTSSWLDSISNINPNFGDYMQTISVGSTLYSTWADSRNADTPSPFWAATDTKAIPSTTK